LIKSFKKPIIFSIKVNRKGLNWLDEIAMFFSLKVLYLPISIFALKGLFLSINGENIEKNEDKR